MKATQTVKENYEFRRIYHKGASAVEPCLVVYCMRNKKGYSRAGFTVSVKLGGAVERNHIRRQMRELYRLHKEETVPGYDLILVARSRAKTTPYQKMDGQYLHALKALHLLKESV